MTKQKISKILKVFIIVLIAIAVLYIITITDYEGISVGMSFQETYDKASTFTDFLCYYEFIFYKNKWGNPVIVYIPEQNLVVTKIRCYSSLWTSSSPAVFNSVKYGMTIYELTALVGLPFATKTSGMKSLSYYDSLGNEYRFYFSRKRESDNWFVNGLRFYERNPDK